MLACLPSAILLRGFCTVASGCQRMCKTYNTYATEWQQMPQHEYKSYDMYAKLAQLKYKFKEINFIGFWSVVAMFPLSFGVCICVLTLAFLL